jgi:hypothetical protein
MGVRPVSGSVLDARISGRRRRSIGRGTTTMWPLLLRTRGKTSWPSIGRRDPMPSVSRRQPPTGAHRPGAGSRSANLIDCFPPRWPTCRSLLVDRPHSWPSGGDARAVPIHAPEERAHGAYYERALATAMRDEQQSLLARRRRLRWTIFDSRRHASPHACSRSQCGSRWDRAPDSRRSSMGGVLPGPPTCSLSRLRVAT